MTLPREVPVELAAFATLLSAGGADLGETAAGGAAPEGPAPGVPAAPAPAAAAALPADVPCDVASSSYEGAAAAGPEGGYFFQ
jgi:hypothetical protein